MALCFALGSACFLIGPFPGYAQLVGDYGRRRHLLRRLDPVHDRRRPPELAGVAGAAQPLADPRPGGPSIIQSAGTLFFNVTTYQAMHTALTSSEYNKLVWRPDWRGSICFLVSGAIAYRASPRHRWRGWLPVRRGAGWWQPAVNLLGCMFFGISAVAGYVVPSTGSVLDQAAANWNTSLGAACFLACALDTLHTGEASKMPVRRWLRGLEHRLESDLSARGASGRSSRIRSGR